MKKGMLALAAMGLLAVTGLAQENYATWSTSRNITINTTATGGGANVVNAVANYPVLVRLTSAQSDVFTAGGTNGASVRFTAADGTTRLKHERERWDSAGKLAEFWVLVPSVAGNANTTIKLFYGKSGAADSSKGSAVFDTTNGFRGVWHMNGTTDEADATINGITMTATNAPTKVTGAIGTARGLDSASHQYFVATNTASNAAVDIPNSSPLTLSGWAYAKGISEHPGYGNSILNKGDQQYCLQIYGANNAPASNNKHWEMTVKSGNSWRQDTSIVRADTGVWVYVTGTWAGGTPATGVTTNAKLYLNGARERDTTMAFTSATQVRTYSVFIGANPSGGTAGTPPDILGPAPRHWHGNLDELTISAVVRDSNWVRLNYETQKPTATAVSVGNVITGIESARDWNPGFAIRGAGTGFVFSVPGASRVSVIDVKGREVWSHVSAQAADVAWNGLSADGSRLSGAYVARVTARVNGVETTVAQRSFSMMK